MKTFKFKLYSNHGNHELHRQIEAYAEIYNHCIALHKRYYRLFGKSVSANRLKVHITELKRTIGFADWNFLASQAIQDVVERIERGYLLLIRNRKHNIKTGPPSFKARRKYKSFTLKQAGWQLLEGGRMRIGKCTYRYFNHRNLYGHPKTCTIKRDSIGDIYIFIVTDAKDKNLNATTTGKTAGFDFGLKTYLTASDGNVIESPQFFKGGINPIKSASKQLLGCKKGSSNRHRARLNLARKYPKIANQGGDFHWKLAHHLTDQYDQLFFERLNLKGMKSLWGRKVSALGFAEFLQKLEYIAEKKGKDLLLIDPWFPSSKTCSDCGLVNQSLELGDRQWHCPSCHMRHNRDRNAAINIVRVGTSTLSGEVVSPAVAG